MAKPFKGNEKDGQSAAPGATSGAGVAAPDFTQTIGGYSPHSSYSPSASLQDQWLSSKLQTEVPWYKLPLGDTPQGRAARIVFTRGGLGALGFTLGGAYASRGKIFGREMGMAGYSPDMRWSEIRLSKPLHFIAKSIDTFAGKPIRAAVKALTGSERLASEAVHFRHSWRDVTAGQGRSLGEEVVGITTDFSVMSAFNAAGVDIINAFDPRVNKPWIDDDKGIDDGKTDPAKIVKYVAKRLWRYVSFNGGEDWAVSIPYAYWMKGQRHLLNRLSPGFKYDADRNLNGGSFKVNSAGDVIGNYNKEGALDLQLRFMAYNGMMPFGTIHFREAYGDIANWLKGKPDSFYGGLEGAAERKKAGWGRAVTDLAKWSMRGMVKASIYMLPTVPFFWMFRTPQSKYKGMFINPDNSAVLSFEHNGESVPVRANSSRYSHVGSRPFSSDTPVHFERYVTGSSTPWQHAGAVENPLRRTGGRFNAFGQSFDAIDATLNQIGRVNDCYRKKIQNIPQALGYSRSRDFTSLASRFANASVAYTPYMYAKGEFANLWDDGKMDISAERMINGLFAGSWKEFKAGAQEVGYTILQKPLPDPEREKAAQERISFRDTASDSSLDKSKGEMRQDVREMQRTIPWTERLVTGKKHPLVDHVRGGDGASLDTTYKIPPSQTAAILSERKPISHAEQEKMREVLASAIPPTNAIN